MNAAAYLAVFALLCAFSRGAQTSCSTIIDLNAVQCQTTPSPTVNTLSPTTFAPTLALTPAQNCSLFQLEVSETAALYRTTYQPIYACANAVCPGLCLSLCQSGNTTETTSTVTVFGPKCECFDVASAPVQLTRPRMALRHCGHRQLLH